MYKNIISIDGYDFIRLDLRGIKKAVYYKNGKQDYKRFIAIVMFVLASNKYEVYLPIPRKYPKFIYKLFRNKIILDSLLFQFNGGNIAFSEITHLFLSKNNQLFFKEVEGFKFYDFSNLHYIEF